MLTNILDTIDEWSTFLDDYNEENFLAKPNPKTWSIGQVYKHLCSETSYFISQASICCTTNDHIDQNMTMEGNHMFANDSFPDEQIVGPPSNDDTPQPKNKQEIIDNFQALKSSIILLKDKMAHSTYLAKTSHPGLGFFNANEWIQFADMHLRHHIKQKNRIDNMLSVQQPIK
jgi:DinB superfamily